MKTECSVEWVVHGLSPALLPVAETGSVHISPVRSFGPL